MGARLTRGERRERTREELIAAADRSFTAQGFHATSVDQIATDAGYTTGAIYSNFASKEDLFFAVYERRTDRMTGEMERILREAGPAEGLARVSTETVQRRGRDDGWLAVFLEFWAHVIRHSELRERFVHIHERVRAPLIEAVERLAEERGFNLPVGSMQFTMAMNAMQVGLALERLTQPDLIDVTLGARLSQVVFTALERNAGDTDGGTSHDAQLPPVGAGGLRARVAGCHAS